jgi:hypothetical protein
MTQDMTVEESKDTRTALQKAADEYKYANDAERTAKSRTIAARNAIGKIIENEAPAIKARYKEAYGEFPEPGPVWNAFFHASLLAAGLPTWYELEDDCMGAL